MGKKPLSLSDHSEAEHVLALLAEHARAGAVTQLKALIGLLLEEPKSVSARNEIIEDHVQETEDLDGALSLEDLKSHQESVGRPLNTLESASIKLMVRLYALHDAGSEELPAVWREESPHLALALSYYLNERDGPTAQKEKEELGKLRPEVAELRRQAEKLREARREGGRQSTRSLLDWTRWKQQTTAKQHDMIREDAERYRKLGYEKRNIANLLSKKYHKQAHQIRVILRTQTTPTK